MLEERKSLSCIIAICSVECWCVGYIHLHHITKPTLIWLRVQLCEFDIMNQQWYGGNCAHAFDHVWCRILASVLCGLIKMTISHMWLWMLAKVLRAYCLWCRFTTILSLTYIPCCCCPSYRSPNYIRRLEPYGWPWPACSPLHCAFHDW